MSATFRDGRLSGGDDPGVSQRLWVAGFGMGLVFAIFGLRLFQLQVLHGAELRERSEKNFVRALRIEAPRGDLLDREGRELATSRPAFAVQVIPNELRGSDLTYRALAMLLGSEASELEATVGEPRGRRRFQPVVLEGDMSKEQRARVDSHRYALPGVVTDAFPRRFYPGHHHAAHLLGSIGEIEAEQLKTRDFRGYSGGDIIGQSALERILEHHLRGHNGGRNVVVDVAGREIDVIDEVPPVRGGRAYLTIDLDLQRAAELAFESSDPEVPDHMGALVALDPRNGDVLAMVSRPTYDPNAFAGGIDSETWKQWSTDPWRPLQNRAIAGQYAPGSTYKAIVAAAALSEGVVDAADEYFCPGWYKLGRRVYRCWKRGGHHEVDLRTALAKSCDVYFYHVGVELGIDKIAEYAKAFGLGAPTGVALKGEASGLVPTKLWKERARKEPWIKGETVSAAIGQGFNLVTPIQLASAYAALASGSKIQPRLVLRRESWDGTLRRGESAVARHGAAAQRSRTCNPRAAARGARRRRRGAGLDGFAARVSRACASAARRARRRS